MTLRRLLKAPVAFLFVLALSIAWGVLETGAFAVTPYNGRVRLEPVYRLRPEDSVAHAHPRSRTVLKQVTPLVSDRKVLRAYSLKPETYRPVRRILIK
jgi:hypothetical protein